MILFVMIGAMFIRTKLCDPCPQQTVNITDRWRDLKEDRLLYRGFHYTVLSAKDCRVLKGCNSWSMHSWCCSHDITGVMWYHVTCGMLHHSADVLSRDLWYDTSQCWCVIMWPVVWYITVLMCYHVTCGMIHHSADVLSRDLWYVTSQCWCVITISVVWYITVLMCYHVTCGMIHHSADVLTRDLWYVTSQCWCVNTRPVVWYITGVMWYI